MAEAEYKPDILAAQEIEKIEDISKFPDGAGLTYWHCERPNAKARKSIGMASYTDTKLTFVDRMDGIRRYQAQKGDHIFHVMAVWTSTAIPPKKHYRQLHDALELQDVVEWVREKPTVILGDFNLNPACKGWKALLALTDACGLVSAYHTFFSKETFGNETRPTHFHQSNEGKKFHIDYCFVPQEWAQHIKNVEVGKYSDWHKLSDHVPLMVDLDLPQKAMV